MEAVYTACYGLASGNIPSTSIRLSFMSITVRFGNCVDGFNGSLLVRVACGGRTAPVSGARDKVIHTGLSPLDGPDIAEDWFAETPVSRGSEEGVYYARSEDACFGWLYFDGSEPLEQVTKEAYICALKAFRRMGFGQLLRAWHYFPGIHAQEGGISRYRRFCRGRSAAFSDYGQKDYCAATVIGTRASFGVMYFLGAREAGVAVENPRQTSAWEYPLPEASERPLFVRAICKRWGGRVHFYGSGTAGIVGYESIHAGGVAVQLREALLNLRALLDRTARFSATRRLSCLKVYVANKDDIGTVRDVLDGSEFVIGERIFFEGEVCREELSIEVEALIL